MKTMEINKGKKFQQKPFESRHAKIPKSILAYAYTIKKQFA
jgi:hypothetical protein